jgi:hypothetical protein
MDRHIVYVGQVPEDVDILYTNLHPYVAIAKLAADVLGTSTQLSGLACAPTSPASLTVTIGPGQIYQLAAIDTTAYGSLPTNSNQILKSGIQLGTITTTAMTAPLTVGYSINYLIEFTLGEVDGGSVVLPYYNSANPSQAYSGPNNSGQPNYTVRQDQVAYQIKAGTAAPTGTQTTPSPDSGYVGGYVITIAQGQTTITSGNISTYSGAPFILPGEYVTEPALQSNQYLYAADSSVSANTITVALTPAITAYTTGMNIFVKIANTNTGASTIAVNGLASKNIQLVGGAALGGGELAANRIAVLTYDGTQFELRDPATPKFQLVTDTGSANAYAATLNPAPTAYYTGLTLILNVANTNTSTSCTLNLNSLGTKNIKFTDITNPPVGSIVSGMEALLIYDGTQFQLLNPSGMATKTGIQLSSYINASDGGSANAYTATLSPAITAYSTGQIAVVKIANTNTGASTINLNSIGTKNITLTNQAAINAGDLIAGMEAYLMYDGTQFQLLNPAGVVKRVNRQVLTSTSGTYTASAGLLWAHVFCIGSGGGGGGATSGSSQIGLGAGGGAGGYCEKIISGSTIGASQSYAAGAAGSGGGAGAAGGAGNASTFGAILTANGGAGGGFASANAGVNGVTGGAGGTATGGDINITGGAGGMALSLAGGAGGFGGQGGSVAAYGTPGSMVVYGNNGNAATGYGAGGGGACSTGSQNKSGGNGAAGVVIVIEYCNQ